MNNNIKNKKEKLVSSMQLFLVVVIVKSKKADFYVDIIHENGANMQLVQMGSGTTQSSLFDGEIGTKAVILATLTQDKIEHLLSILDEKFKTVRDGKGVAFVVPMSSVMGAQFFNFLANNKNTMV